MREASLLVVVALLATSCTLLVSTSDLSGGDAGAPVAFDAGADVSSDSGSTTDAGNGPCSAAGVVFCETFDRADATKTYVNTTDPETSIATDDVMFSSPPRSAKFVITASNNGSPDATLELRPPGSLSDFAFEAKLHIEKNEPGGVGRLLYIKPSGGEEIIVEQSGTVKSGATTSNIGAFAIGKWLSFRLEVRATTQPSKAAIEIDGQRSEVNLASAWVVAPLLVRIGVSEAFSPKNGWIVRWDDVVVRTL